MSSSSPSAPAKEETTVDSGSPRLCAKGCGFYGSVSTDGLCSKCHLCSTLKNILAALSDASPDDATAPGESEPAPPAPVAMVEPGKERRPRCAKCDRKLGAATGLPPCRCGGVFCRVHRHPEEHACGFDYRAAGRAEAARKNPHVRADKLPERL